MIKLAKGDRVKYSDAFIKSVQGHEIAHDRGTIVEVIKGKGPDRARIQWDGDGGLSSALLANLAKAR